MAVRKNSKAENEMAEDLNITAEPKRKIAYTDRAVITNTRSWNLNFKSTENNRDIVIPAGAERWSKLTVAEIEGQIQTGNFFFIGADGDGNNAYIKIEDEDVRRFVFHLDDTENSDRTILDAESVKKLLAINDKAEFEAELERLVVTDGDKRMIIPTAIKAGVDDVQSYKISAIEKISGYKF